MNDAFNKPDKNRRGSSIILLFALFLTACAPRYYYVKPLPPPLSAEEIVDRSREGTEDNDLIREIDESGTVLYLRTAAIIELRDNGVSERVIDHLIAVKEWSLLNAAGTYPTAEPEKGYVKRTEARRFVPVSIH